MTLKVSGNTRELKSPPGREVEWTIFIRPSLVATYGQVIIQRAKTAFEATMKRGLLLSQCEEITWKE